jgi:hypothetical protein
VVVDTGRQTGNPIDDLVPAARRIGKAIEAVIEGKRDAIQLTLAVLLAEGHLLIEAPCGGSSSRRTCCPATSPA